MKKMLKIVLILLVFALLLVAYSFLEPRWLKTKLIDLQSDNIPNSFVGTNMSLG